MSHVGRLAGTVTVLTCALSVPAVAREAEPPDEGSEAKPEVDSNRTRVRLVRSAEEDTSLDHGEQLGFIVRSEIDVQRGEVGPAAGISIGVGPWFEVSALALVQRLNGTRIAAAVLLPAETALKGVVRAGVPVFFDDGAHPGFHFGAGLQWDVGRRLGFTADFSLERFGDLPPPYHRSYVIVGTGVQVRLF